MAEPKTPHELNEAVAKKLGLAKCLDDRGHVWVDEYFQRDKLFDPATDPAAALWALERYCDERKLDPALEKYEGHWECQLWHDVAGGSKVLNRGEGTFCEAICRAIVKAAE